MPKRQIIKLKSADSNRAIIRGLNRSAWETKKSLGIEERIQLSQKRQAPKHKKRFFDLEEEF